MLEDPVTLYKDGKLRRIPAVDAPGWIAAGWSKEAGGAGGQGGRGEEFSPLPTPTSPPPSDTGEEIAPTPDSPPKRSGKRGLGVSPSGAIFQDKPPTRKLKDDADTIPES